MLILLMTFLACPSFWDPFGGSCYWFRPYIAKKWDEASEDCRNRGADLVKISSSKEQEFITGKMSSSPVILKNCLVCINHITWILSAYGA